MRLRFLGVVVPIAGLIVSTTTASASSEQFNPPKQYYLALGDSLAYGYQDAKFKTEIATGTFSAASFPGYAGDFAGLMRVVDPGLQLENLGCPGETTVSYFNPLPGSAAGCPFPYPLLHDPYTSSQRDAALTFLAAHPGQVSPITLDNGANDISACASSSDPNCIPDALTRVSIYLDRALGELRDAAPNAEIIVMEYYDPFAFIAPGTLAPVQALNAIIVKAAAAHRARVADAFTPINLGPQPQTLCKLTLICTGDVHASDEGYTVIAQQFFAASGYSRLGD